MKWLSANHWENKWFSIPSDLPKNLAVCGQQGKLVTTHIITWVWSVHSHPLSAFLTDFFTFVISFPPHQHFHWLQNFLPQDSFKTALKKSLMTFTLLPPIINSQSLYLTSEQPLSWLITPSYFIYSLPQLFHSHLVLPLPRWSLHWFLLFSLLLNVDYPRAPSLTSFLSLFTTYLTSSIAYSSTHIILIPPSENVYLQSKTFSWTLDLNIQLPTWFLHFYVYEASQT